MRSSRRARGTGIAFVLLAGMFFFGSPASLLSQSDPKRGDISAAPDSVSLAAGRKIFSSTCAGCHGLDGHGGERAPDILARPEVQRMSEAEISSIVRDGTQTKVMPAFGKILDARQIRDVAIYLRSLLQSHSGPAALPGDPAAGKLLFFGKAGCADCHMVEGAGGFLGADLTAYAEPHSMGEIRDAITGPARSPQRHERAVSVTTRDGEHFTGITRNEDNFSLQVQTPDGAFHLLMRANVEEIEYPGQPLMPTDYAQRLSAGELNDLVSFLMRAAVVSAASEPRDLRRRNPDED